MRIKLSNGGKRFNREWIFRHANLELTGEHAYAITGPNGSGKSTLLQSIGGMLQLSEGSIAFEMDGAVKEEDLYRHVTLCAPYLDVIEELTLVEFLEFHLRFKPLLEGLTIREITAILDLQKASHKQIRYYSSGMKQRVKLAQAMLSASPVVLLDEPCSNLDEKGIALYHHLVETYCRNRLVIVCSNDPVEYSFCDVVLNVQDFKTNRKLIS